MTKTIFKSAFVAVLALLAVSCGKKYAYESVQGDPMNSRIYTLDNGLKVYLTVNKDEPRIQTYIAVRSGGKNDPHETTGLAHYFEHLMFKGTERFGTLDYAAEKPYLDRIEQEFEKYRTMTDPAERKAQYSLIDSLSYEASKYAVPNEYDKLMSAIGASGTNAYTSYDQTVFTDDIPSNQIDNWAKIQADRFGHNVIRLFHTELEAVYEEKNMSLTSDSEKMLDKLLSGLFKKHPYGTQTILGTQEQLKSPSITNIKNYYHEWYVPNNMAVCMSGDFDPDYVIAEIDKYFGEMKPNENLKKLSFEPEDPIVKPEHYSVVGAEAPFTFIGWRTPGAADSTADVAMLTARMLTNGKAGLIDANVNRQQRTLFCLAQNMALADYGCFVLIGQPKAGQTLDEVQDILFEQLDKLKKGDFDENLLTAAVNNYKVGEMQRLRENSSRADMFVDAFVNDIPWEESVKRIDNLSKITKDDIVAYANKYLGDSSYVRVDKHIGTDASVVKMDKPQITPIMTNRDSSSKFLGDIQAAAPAPIDPVFIDFGKDLSKGSTSKGVEVLYKQNTGDGLFDLVYYYDFGSNEDNLLSTSADYLDFLGTADMTNEQFKSELYRLACNYSVSVRSTSTRIIVSGLAENMDAAVKLVESLLSGCVADEQALAGLKANTIKSRSDSKLGQRENFNAFTPYLMYGPENPQTVSLNDKDLNALSSEKLICEIHGLLGKKHSILYYGPENEKKFIADIETVHQTPDTLVEVPRNEAVKLLVDTVSNVVLAPYKANNIYLMAFSDRGDKFSPSVIPMATLFNEYYGGGMNSVVFQEIREARGLAYSAYMDYMLPEMNGFDCSAYYMIITQNDKMTDALKAFGGLLSDMTRSQTAFDIAQDAIMARVRTMRTLRMDVINAYIRARKLGLDHDANRDIFEKVPGYTLDDIAAFFDSQVKGRHYTIGILGDESDLDMEALKTYGPVRRVTTDEIFGY